MRNTVFVVAKHYADYKIYQRNNYSEEIYHDDIICADSIRGYRNIDFVITDEGWHRKDIKEIIQVLIMCNIYGPYENKTKLLRMEQLLYG